MKQQPVLNRVAMDWDLCFIEKEIVSTARTTTDLIRNCDLPPPQRFIIPFPHDQNKEENHIEFPSPEKSKVDWVADDGDESTGVLRALHLSQTRAREAEAKASLLTQRNKKMVGLIQKDALTIYSYKQMVRLLEIKIKWLEEEEEEEEEEEQKKKKNKSEQSSEEEGVDLNNSNASGSWCLALGFCLGVAGIGIVVGFRCYLLSD